MRAPDLDYPLTGRIDVTNPATLQTYSIPVTYQPDDHYPTREVRRSPFEWADGLVLLLVCALLYMACTGAFNRDHHLKIK